MNEFKVITLCGSTRFKDQFIEIQKKLTLEGNIVISVGAFGYCGDNEVWAEGTKAMLDRMHGAPDKPCGEDARMLTQNCR